MGLGESETMERPFHIYVRQGAHMSARYSQLNSPCFCEERLLPTYHECRRENEAKVQQLGGHLPGVLQTGHHFGWSIVRA
jgi:hypothetical protein